MPPASTGAPAEREYALALLGDLEASGVNGLCHGDASPWNLLIGKDGRTVLIDPRGLAGEVEYDVAVVALKATTVLPLHVTVPYLATKVDVDPERVRTWTTVANAARV